MAGMDHFSKDDSGKQSYSDFLLAIQEAAADEEKSVEEINKLKITNLQNLGRLQRNQEYDLVQEYTQMRLKAANKIATDEHKKLKETQKQRSQDAIELSKAEFKAKWGFEKSQIAQKEKTEEKNLDKQSKLREKHAKKEAKEALKEKKKENQQQLLDSQKQDRESLLGKGKSLSERWKALKRIGSTGVYDDDGNEIGRKFSLSALAANLTNALSDIAKMLDSRVDQIAGYKSAVDTRLQGLTGTTNKWDTMSKDITRIAGISPLIKQSALAERINAMIGQGIAFNVEQRAVLQEMSGKIATTFDATNATLLRLVRIQQQDTTAGRLGMESALTAFLNNMYQTTEYMTNVANSIKGSLEEAMSLMSGENALSFEYQVQKWLGSLYSVGMSDTAVQGLGGVLGKLAAGQLEAITSGGQSNLVIMAANQAGMSVANMLHNGLDSNSTNRLMNAMVEYLAKIYQEAGDSKVIQQQMASIYGVTAADLKAAVNLAKSAGIISMSGLTYASALSRLESMASTMYERTSIGEMMTNAFDNAMYSMAAGIANNPALYGVYKSAGLLDSLAGGLEFSLPLVMGTGTAQTFNVANIMRAAALVGGISSSLGTMLSSGGNGGIDPLGILRAAGYNGTISAVSRGTGQSIYTVGGMSVSESGALIGNASSSDMQNQAMTSASDSTKAQVAEAADESEETKLKDIRSDILDIYHLMQEIANGNYTIAVDVKNPSLKIDTVDIGL